ncbi:MULTISPECIES: AAA family ATPase [unclassified Microcoleus]|uniref:AAA family ATPase n=1 Tax=unclassified Microcoleus TaxID=2642155 RepID=UPI002FCEE7C1
MNKYLPSLIQQMLLPSFYNHEVTPPIELIQTHLSFVLLTGKYAYKVKKPVNFGFIDCSTLEKRYVFCKEELRLNQRLAPELYLKVIPISKNGSAFMIAENNQEAVEYAVKMYQFPQSDLFINLFQAGKLTEDYIIEIAKKLVEFHRLAPTSEYIAGFGSVNSLKTVIEEHYHHTPKYIDVVQEQDLFEQTKAFTNSCFLKYSSLISERIQQGKVKECHGDIHLKNICLFEEKIQIFDSIEFNESFRNSDILYDIAFLFMDLNFRGKNSLANLFLNTYLEYSGDYEGVQLLPLFTCMRAYIRATVTSFLIDDTSISPSEKQLIKEESAAYYRFAWKSTQSHQGKLIVMSGISGTGKSTIARKLAQVLNAIHIRSDAVRKHIAGVSLMEKAQELYFVEMTEKTYTRLITLGLLLVNEGFNVILDAKFDRRGLRASLIQQAEKSQISWQLIHCDSPLGILRQRLQKRLLNEDDISGATPKMLDSQKLQFEEFSQTEMLSVMSIDTSQGNIEQIVQDILMRV